MRALLRPRSRLASPRGVGAPDETTASASTTSITNSLHILRTDAAGAAALRARLHAALRALDIDDAGADTG